MKEIIPLTSLRGIAAALVAWGHFHLEFPAPTRVTLFVDLFFVLSGFVMWLAYKERVTGPKSYAKFLWLRIGRVYPVHIATLLLAVVAIEYVNTMTGNPLFHWRDTQEGLWKNLLMVQAWPPGGAYSWNMPSWSISAEWAAYLLFPVFLILARYLRLAFILVVLAGWVAFYLHRDGVGFGPGWAFGVHRCLLGFGLGIWLAMLKPPRIVYSDAMTILCVLAAVSVWVFKLSDWFIVAPFALLVLNLSGNAGICGRVMSWGPLYGLGLISYSLYMVHYPIYKLWQFYHRREFGADGMAPTEMWVAAGVMSLIVLAASYVLWVSVEEPCRRWSKRVIGRKPRLPSQPVQGPTAITPAE